jgi:integrase
MSMATSDRQHRYGMGRLYRRGRIWWVRYYRNREAFNESSRSEKETDAKKLLQQRMGEIVLGRFAGPKADKGTLAELAQDLLTDYQIRGRKNQRQVKSKVNYVLAHFGHDRAKSVMTDRIKTYIATCQHAGAAVAQINRELAALKRMFNLALQAEKLPSAPYIPSLTENNVRTGFFEYEEFLALRKALPDFLKPVVTFGYYTGWWSGEVLTLCSGGRLILSRQKSA